MTIKYCKCGSPVSSGNKTGRCWACYQKEDNAPRKCTGCGVIIEARVKSGLCRACWLAKRSVRVCKKCGKVIVGSEGSLLHGLCFICANRTLTCQKCNKPMYDFGPHTTGLCRECFLATCNTRPDFVCSVCGEHKPHKTKGMCKTCYSRYQASLRPVITCPSCGELAKLHVKGLCRTCYTATRPSNAVYGREYAKQRRKDDPMYRIVGRLRARMRKALTRDVKATVATKDMLGCDIPEFKVYLENQFTPGMSWENHSIIGWHLHHIKPCAMFDLTNIEQIKECFHYTNYKPMWADDHLLIGAKYNGINYRKGRAA